MDGPVNSTNQTEFTTATANEEEGVDVGVEIREQMNTMDSEEETNYAKTVDALAVSHNSVRFVLDQIK
ncbi:unnamed protein product [Adineta steineri]|uniref:Uncharacterized protein n=1 Tax=Adineta steineri TaxID=433720 RepID=A0A813RXI7_9BILA|nr:unnamed protein product [Adineta steineri]CAF3780222.1 unnamed protein product [Adineta steineri]